MENCVDINLCLTLSHGKPDLAAEILTLLLNELPLNSAEINQALDESRFDDARDLIHKLHGACCYCGVPALKTICKKLERQLTLESKAPGLSDRKRFDKVVETLLTWKAQNNIQDFFALLNK